MMPFPATREQVEQLCDLLAAMGLNGQQIAGLGRAAIGMAARNCGCGGGGVIRPVGRGELHNARSH